MEKHFSMYEDKLFFIITFVLSVHMVAMKHVSVCFKTNGSVSKQESKFRVWVFTTRLNLGKIL